MAALHFQPQFCTIPSIFFSSSNRRSKLPQSSCCVTFVRLGLQSSPSRFSFRLKDCETLVLSRTIIAAAHASNSDSSDTSSNSCRGTIPYEGPPFLTLLAAILVFIAVCWAFGSLVFWLLSLIVKLPPSSSSPK